MMWETGEFPFNFNMLNNEIDNVFLKNTFSSSLNPF